MVAKFARRRKRSTGVIGERPCAKTPEYPNGGLPSGGVQISAGSVPSQNLLKYQMESTRER